MRLTVSMAGHLAAAIPMSFLCMLPRPSSHFCPGVVTKIADRPWNGSFHYTGAKQ